MSCCKCNLFNFSCVKKWVPIEGIVQETNVSVVMGINTVHQKDIRSLLGQTCFDLLCNLKDDEIVIIDQFIAKMEPWASWLIYYNLLNSLPFNPSGFVNMNTNNSEQASRTQINNASKFALEQIEFYLNELLEFIEDNLAELQYYLPCLEICSCCKTCSTTCKCKNSSTPNIFFRSVEKAHEFNVNRYA